MELQFATVTSLVKSLIPALKIPSALSVDAMTEAAPVASHFVRAVEMPAHIPLSHDAVLALAPLNLPADGLIDPATALRAKLLPDVAARNFVRWAQALALSGPFSRRSVYALYCEFSEVDHRTPVRDVAFLEALSRTDGILRERSIAAGGGRGEGPWQWTIVPAAQSEALQSIDIDQPVAPAGSPVSEEIPAPAVGETPPSRLSATISRFVLDDDHPFSPAKLREHAKGARRARLNAAASRKQRGALRRAA
jgi:hypothetical protein